MTRPPTTTTLEQALAENHRFLAAANALDSRWPRNERTASEIRPQWLQALTEFRDHLRSHFALEEDAGYLADVLAAAPELARQVQSLQQEHCTLAATLDRLISTVGGSSADGHQVVAEHQLFHELISKIKAHEHAENSLVMEAVDREIGAGD